MSIGKAICAGTIVATLLTAGCGGDSSTDGCTKDTDCKGDRICQDGTCVGGEGGSTGGTTSSGSTSQTGTTTSQTTGSDGIHCFNLDGTCTCDHSGSTPDEIHCDPAVIGPAKCCADIGWPDSGKCGCYTISCAPQEGSCLCTGDTSMGAGMTCTGPLCCVWEPYLQFNSYTCLCYEQAGGACPDTYVPVGECTLNNFKTFPCADGQVFVDKCN